MLFNLRITSHYTYLAEAFIRSKNHATRPSPRPINYIKYAKLLQVLQNVKICNKEQLI